VQDQAAEWVEMALSWGSLTEMPSCKPFLALALLQAVDMLSGTGTTGETPIAEHEIIGCPTLATLVLFCAGVKFT
jgi:hypothetical protein